MKERFEKIVEKGENSGIPNEPPSYKHGAYLGLAIEPFVVCMLLAFEPIIV